MKKPLIILCIALCAAFCGLLLPGCSSQRESFSTPGFEMGRILGLREFIVKAEKDRIIKLAEENPNYFYRVLPFAYVLNVTGTWAKHFEDIALNPPGWYEGAGNFTPSLFTKSIHTAMGSFEYHMGSFPTSHSSGSSSGGSGSSGGSTSGCGGGGGGGGSW